MVILLFSGGRVIFGQDFLVEEDLRLDWVFYDEKEKVMLPFLDNSNENPVAIHLALDVDHGKEAYLMLEIPSNTSLFIENKMVEYVDEQATRFFLLDSLKNIFEKDTLQLTLFYKDEFENPVNAKIGFIHRTFDSSLNVNPITGRNLDSRGDYMKIIILAIVTFFVTLYTLFPYDLFDFLSFRTLITFRYTDTAMTKFRSITKTQTLVILYHAALSACIVYIFLNYYYNPFGNIFIMRINPIFAWILIFGIMLLSLVFKYILIGIISILFGLSDKINFYFIEFLRMAMIFYSLIFVIISFAIINHIYSLDVLLETLLYAVILFNIIRFILIYFKFRATLSIKNLHLFSYLCTTELIPIVLGFKFFIK